MYQSKLIIPENWLLNATITNANRIVLDYKRVSENQFETIRNAALGVDLESMIQLIVWCQVEVSQNKVSEWASLFERLNFKDTNSSEFYLKGYVMNHLADILRERKFSTDELQTIVNSDILKSYIFESFVDYQTLSHNGYYGRLVEEFNPATLEQETFKKSLTLTKYYLEGNVPMMRKWAEALSRYPTDETYFPIINGRVWAARFLNQALKKGKIQDELVLEWFKHVQNEPTAKVTQFVLEPLPILLKFLNNLELMEEILDFVTVVAEINLLQNPLVASIENAILLACKTAFYKRKQELVKSQEFRLKLVKNSCLPSYQSYIQGIANSF